MAIVGGMKPVHFFILIVLFILIGLVAYYLWGRNSGPAEVVIAIDPVKQSESTPPSTDDSLDDSQINDPSSKPDYQAGFDKASCRWLVRHIPDDDVAYKPGVDVHGKPVVPADLGGGYKIELPRTVQASVSRRLLKHPNLKQETPFAMVEIDLTTGAVKINGQGLGNQEYQDLIAYCQDQN